jgi:phenylacetate-CoA ligase
MNPFINPVNSIPFLKEYIFGPNRIYRLNRNRLEKYKDRVFRKILKYAFNVPLYHDLYKKAGVYLSDVKGLKDISKLPFVTKKDFVSYFPDGLTPNNYDRDKAILLSTSGSTGKTVSFYVDFHTVSRGLCSFFRDGINYDFNWRKIKYVSIGNFSPGKADQIIHSTMIDKSKVFWNYDKNYLKMNAYDNIKEIIKKLNDFRPYYIISYPVTFQQLAFFKRKGYCDNINPKIIAVSGYKLDEYTRNYIKDAFNCLVVDLYAAAESLGSISFECVKGTIHVNHDFYHIEAVDGDMNLVSEGESGHVIFTRLFGKGTPFIRYTGLDDWVTIGSGYKCDCGLQTPIFKNGVEGRRSTSVVLPSGLVVPSASFDIVSLVLKDLGTYKVTQFQIIQNKVDDIEICLVVDNDFRDVGPSVDIIIKRISEAYDKKYGPDIKIKVKEVREIKSPPGKPLPLVISKVKIKDALKILDSR